MLKMLVHQKRQKEHYGLKYFFGNLGVNDVKVGFTDLQFVQSTAAEPPKHRGRRQNPSDQITSREQVLERPRSEEC